MIAKVLPDDLTYAQVNSENPNICFLHGWGGESNDWKNISKEFKSSEIFQASDMMVESLTKLLDRERNKRKAS